MKTRILLSIALAAATAFTALPAAAQSSNPTAKLRCIDVKNIRETISRDGGETLTFRLHNGTTVVNRLLQTCDGLKFGGFVWVVSPPGEVCENNQTLRTLVTGEICRLGKFDTPVKAAAR